MKKDISLWMGTLAIIITFSIILIPQKAVHAAFNDGTYDIDYEVKEAGNDNTSIADGYFTKPATLTVTDGTQYIQLTVTSSSMIKSLSAPSGPVEIVSEDEGNETRTVKFRVDGDLSQPVPMDMHIVVPDLYDMEHTARIVFDVSGLDTVSENEENEDSQADDQSDPPSDHENSDENANSSTNGSNDDDIEVSENNDDVSNDENDDKEENVEEKESERLADSTNQQENDDASTSTSSIYWIASIILGLIIIAAVVFWIIRKKINR